MIEFKTYNDKNYEKDPFCRIFEKALFLLVCPPLILLLPFMIIDDFQEGNILDAIIFSFIFGLLILFIIGFLSSK